MSAPTVKPSDGSRAQPRTAPRGIAYLQDGREPAQRLRHVPQSGLFGC